MPNPTPSKMTKVDLVAKVAQSTNITKKKAAEVVEAVMDTIRNQTLRGGVTVLAGFGKFDLRDRAPRKARNPQTGEAIVVPARKAAVCKLTFKP